MRYELCGAGNYSALLMLCRSMLQDHKTARLRRHALRDEHPRSAGTERDTTARQLKSVNFFMKLCITFNLF
jgi:hypothetical protein